MEVPRMELMSALASLYECGKYSDLTLVCGMKRYSVHRAIVCSRSEFFEGACRNPFREAETGVIDLTEDDPEAVEHMVNYFYHLDYLKKSLSRRTSQRSSRKSPMAPHSIERRGPKKLDISQLEDPLLAMMASATRPAGAPPSPPIEQPNGFDSIDASAKLHYTPRAEKFEEDECDSAEDWSEQDTETPNFLVHVRVYALAEKYGIEGLKCVALKKFAQQVEYHFDSPEFPAACQEAYETTVESDRGLRDVIVQTFRANPDLPFRSDVELMMRDTPGLAFEMFRMISGLPLYS